MKNKKIILAMLMGFFISLVLFLMPYSALADQASLSLSPITGGPYKIGNTFSINIWAKTGGANVDTIRASLAFPSNLLEAQSVALGSTYSAPSGGNYINNNNGTIYWGAGAYGGTTSDATFATIIFKAKSAGTATVGFATDSLMISAGQAVPFIKSSGAYIIETIAQTPVPTAPQPTPSSNTPIQQQAPITGTLTPKTIINTLTNVTKDNDLVVFEGQASVGSAEIRFEVEGGLVNAGVLADENGNWKWTVPKGLAPGQYVLRITAIHPEDSSVTTEATQDLEITITEALEVLFDVILNVKKESKKIFSGDNLKLDIKLVNFGEKIESDTITNVEIKYLIENSNREKVFSQTEKRQVVGRESSFAKELAIPENLKSGQYFVSAQMTYGDRQEASSSDTFEIKSNLWGENNINIIISIIAIAAVMIIIILSKAWKKGTKRKK